MDRSQPPLDDLAAVEAAAWDMLARGASERGSAFRPCTLATTRPNGAPAARTIILRAADREGWTLRFCTDARSAKVGELTANPRAELLFYDRAAEVQLRARGAITLHRQCPIARAAWNAMPPGSKRDYGQSTAPGTVLATPGHADRSPPGEAAGYAAFVVAVVQLAELEWLHLASAGHRRARLTPEASSWLAP